VQTGVGGGVAESVGTMAFSDIPMSRTVTETRNQSELVFASSVQSGFLPPKWATVDRNRSRTDPHIAGTEPDHLGPVYFGSWDQFKPIQTGFFR
jgi:hypothetical protein